MSEESEEFDTQLKKEQREHKTIMDQEEEDQD